MKILAEQLCSDEGEPVRFRASPNHAGALKSPRFIVIHYTAGRTLAQSEEWLCNPKAKASAHLIIGADRKIVQLVPFDRIAYHAGKSEWAGLTKLNEYSIGIELDNPGPLDLRGDGGYATWFGARVKPADVVLAPHKHAPPGSKPTGWAAYPDAQIQAAYEACEALIDHIPTIEDVIGHDDVAPGRKRDPGPAFPMDSFRSWLFGRGAG